MSQEEPKNADERLREGLLDFVDRIKSSSFPEAEKATYLLAIIAEQMIEARFRLEEIRDKL